jgi:hypothetical protein
MTTLTPERLARLERTADRLEILDCLARVARGADRSDRDVYFSAFHPDAHIELPNRSGPPSASFENGTAHLAKTHQTSHHHILNHTCEIDGDVAHAETYYIFLGRNFDETSRIAYGRYFDRLERRNGAWRIARRRIMPEGHGVIPPKTAIQLENLPVMGEKGGPTRDKNDPSYAR